MSHTSEKRLIPFGIGRERRARTDVITYIPWWWTDNLWSQISCNQVNNHGLSPEMYFRILETIGDARQFRLFYTWWIFSIWLMSRSEMIPFRSWFFSRSLLIQIKAYLSSAWLWLKCKWLRSAIGKKMNELHGNVNFVDSFFFLSPVLNLHISASNFCKIAFRLYNIFMFWLWLWLRTFLIQFVVINIYVFLHIFFWSGFCKCKTLPYRWNTMVHQAPAHKPTSFFPCLEIQF